jgi:hypothetical protein
VPLGEKTVGLVKDEDIFSEIYGPEPSQFSDYKAKQDYLLFHGKSF